MTTDKDIGAAALVYNGASIRERGEMLSLTDMWRSVGSPENREPFNWARKEGAPFIEAVAVTHNLPDSQVIASKRGKGGATFAHWQIGLAYAKYLSPEFHMWCNAVVRERMEGQRQQAMLPATVLEQIERSFGIMRATIHKVTALGEAVAELRAAPVVPVLDYAGTVTSDVVIEMAGIDRADRVRGTSNLVTHALLDFCDGVGCFRTAADLNPARPWRFPREKAREWLFGTSLGAERIRNQIARQKMRRAKKSGQATFHLVAPRPADDQQPSA